MIPPSDQHKFEELVAKVTEIKKKIIMKSGKKATLPRFQPTELGSGFTDNEFYLCSLENRIPTHINNRRFAHQNEIFNNLFDHQDIKTFIDFSEKNQSQYDIQSKLNEEEEALLGELPTLFNQDSFLSIEK